MMRPMSEGLRRGPVAWGQLLVLMGIELALHAWSNGPARWGYMTDELYFLDSVDKLDWGFVDHPPLSIALLALLRPMIGDSIFALRVVPSLLGAVSILLAALMAREMGGGRTAQGLAGLAVLACGALRAMSSYYSMNAIDNALWPLAGLLLLRILDGGSPWLWVGLGVVAGLGSLNKVSVLWFSGGLLVGLAVTPARRWLRTPWPWVAGAIQLCATAPFFWWQWRHGWPFVEFSRNAALHKVGEITIPAFLVQQALSMNPMAVPMALLGLVYGFSSDVMRPYRPVLWIFVTVAAFLAATGSARPHYLAPAFAIAFAAGAVAVERMRSDWRGWRWLPAAMAGAIALGGMFGLPVAMPMMSPESTIAYIRATGLRPLEERERGGMLPMHLGLYFHAEAVLGAVAPVYLSLPPEEQARVVIVTRSFGETAALNVLGRRRGLPGSVGTHNQYWLWGPGQASGDPTIILHDSEDTLRRWFESCEKRAEIDCPYCMEMMDAQSVWLCRHPRRPLRELWAEMKHYE
jgi:hypothetical protein